MDNKVKSHTSIAHVDVEIIRTFISVEAEINRQDKKWGAGRTHDTAKWNQILMEEVGEAAEAGNHHTFDDKSTEDMETELIQVAAVAIQAATSLRKQRHANPRAV